MKVTNLFTEKDREVFDRIDRDCLAMHIVPPPKTFLRLDVVGPDGEPLERYEDRAHSWVRNAYNAMAFKFTKCYDGAPFGEGKLSIKRDSGAVESGSISATLIHVANSDAATAGQIQRGIVVGSGADAFSFESFQLAAKILHGNSAGQLSYSAQNATAKSYDADSKKWTFTIVRYFGNNSGGDVTVKEVGLYGDSAYNILTCRDVLAEVDWITIPNAGQLTVTYEIEMTFPA